MASKNKPRELTRDIINVALSYTNSDYPKEDGYKVTRHGNEIRVDKWSKKYDNFIPVFTIDIKRCINL